MSQPPTRRTGTLILLITISGCSHSDPLIVPDYAQVGGGSFAGLGPDAVWTDDGAGLLFTGSCLTNQTAKGPLYAPALSVIPAVGGQISWQRCEHVHSDRLPVDSQAALWGAALGSGGRLIYLESVTYLQGLRGTPSTPPLSFPKFTDAALWLADSADPLSRRQKLLSLYHVDTSGIKTIPDDQVDWLLNVVWDGHDSFVALGANLLSRLGVYRPTPLRVVRGTIGSAEAILSPVAGTERARVYALAQSGGTVVFVRDSGAVERVPLSGGSAVTVATVPSLAGRAVMDLSCKVDVCLVLTQEPNSSGSVQSSFWSVSLTSGVLTLVETVQRALSTAKISPRSNTVVASGSLLTGLVH